MAPKQHAAAAARKPSSPAVAKKQQDGPKPNFYNGPTEIATKKTKSSASGSPLTISSVKASSKPRSPLRKLLLRLFVSFTLLSLLFCPPQLTATTPAICRPASQYHQTLQPYIQPHINSVVSATQAHLGPYYAPYRPQVDAVGARLGSLGSSAVDAASPYAAAARSAVVKNYKQHVAPRVHYAGLRLSAVARPHVGNVVVRYQLLVRPYIVRAQAAHARFASALGAHPYTAVVQAKTAQAAQLVQAVMQSAYQRAHPHVARFSGLASTHASQAVAQGKSYASLGAAHGSRLVKETVLPSACRAYKTGKDLGFSAGKKAAFEVKRIAREVVQPRVAHAAASFDDKIYQPYLAEYLEPLYQPAKLIVKTTAHQAVQLGRPVVRYSALALELTARYTKLVFNQVVSPAVSRTAASFDKQVYTPYLAQHVDPVLRPVQAAIAAGALQGQKIAGPVLGQARKLALPVWHRYFPEPKEPTLLEKVQESVEAASNKIGGLFVGHEVVEEEEDLTVVEQIKQIYREKVEEARVPEEEAVAEASAAAVEEDVPEAEEVVEEEAMTETEPELAHPVVTPALVVPGAPVAEVEEHVLEDAAAEDLADEELSTDDEDEDDEDADFLASLEASDDPVEIAVPEIHEPELPELPGADDTAAQVADKEALKKAAVSEMRQEIEKKQHDYEEKMRRVGELEEQKLINELVDIRSRAVSSFPRVAEHWITTVEKDANKAVKSIEKYFRRSNLKWDDIESAVLKGRTRVDGKADDAAEGVNEWLSEIENREEHAVTNAGDKVDAVAAEAVNALGLAYAWLDDVTRHDWARYHGISKSAADWHDIFAEHAVTEKSSADLASSSTDVDALLEAFREELDQVQDGFGARIGILKTNAMLKLDREDRKARGLPEEDADAPMVSIQPIWDAIGGGAAVGAGVIGKGKEQVIDALSQASEAALGAASTTDSGIVAQVTSQAAAFVEAATEAVISTTTETGFVEQATHAVEAAFEEVTSEAAALAEDASSIFHSATRAAASAVGVTPSPESPAEHVESLFAAISEGASSVVEVAAESLHEATRAASRAVGATPTPETVAETLEQVVEDVKSLAEEGYENVQEALHVGGEL